MKTTKAPMVKSLDDAALVAHYLACRALAYNAAALRSRRLGWLLRQIDICCAVARRRGLRLPVSV